MKLSIIVEGQTERVFIPKLRDYLKSRLPGNMPKLAPYMYDGRIPTGDKLKRVVSTLLSGQKPADHVLALTDVYTGSNPPDFKDAGDAKKKMREWVGPEPRFHPHAAQHDFEAWLLPYWSTIQKLAQHNRNAPAGNPESVNHNKPPSYHIIEIFENGKRRDSYIKTRDAGRILKNNDLSLAVAQCSELRALMETIIKVCA